MSALSVDVRVDKVRHTSCLLLFSRTAGDRPMLKTTLRHLSAFQALTLIFAAGTASAEDWPSHPVSMVVPFAAGSSTDVAGRIVAAALSEALGQQVFVENLSGGGGMTGTARVAKAPPDGYQFVFASVDSMAIVPAMHKKPLYDSVADFTPVGLAVDKTGGLLVADDVGGTVWRVTANRN